MNIINIEVSLFNIIGIMLFFKCILIVYKDVLKVFN